MNENQNVGYLIVNVTTARGAIPLNGATVSVFHTAVAGSPLVTVTKTGTSGKTERISLAAPNRISSMSPSNEAVKPYATYTVQVEKEGYYTVTGNDVPIFDGITSIQSFEMIPLAEYDSANIYPRTGLSLDERESF